MNKITLEQATAIVGASLAEGWMEAANIMIEKAAGGETRKLEADNGEMACAANS